MGFYNQSTSNFLNDPLIPCIVESPELTSEQPKPCFNAEIAPSRAFSEYKCK